MDILGGFRGPSWRVNDGCGKLNSTVKLRVKNIAHMFVFDNVSVDSGALLPLLSGVCHALSLVRVLFCGVMSPVPLVISALK